jgi:ribokinase/sulfofructose kinase
VIDEWYAVSNLPEADGGAFASEVSTAFGGVGANVSVALDRLGRDVGLVSRVGDDEYGRRAREHLADTGVDGSRVAVGDDSSTRSLILSDPDGERAIVTTGESFRSLRLGEATHGALAATETVFLTGYTPDSVSRAVLDVVASAPHPPALVFDLSGPVEELVGRGTEPETIHRLLYAADLFVVGDVAAGAYFGGPGAALDRVAAVHRARASEESAGADDGWPRAVLTHGADGMTVVAAGDVTSFDAFEVDAMDSTGAGDAFVAGLIDRWVAPRDRGGSGDTPVGVADGVRFAAAAAAINCGSRFAQPGLPNRETVEAFLAERQG